MLGDIDHLRLLMIGDDPRPGEQRPVMIEVGRVTPGRMRVRTPSRTDSTLDQPRAHSPAWLNLDPEAARLFDGRLGQPFPFPKPMAAGATELGAAEEGGGARSPLFGSEPPSFFSLDEAGLDEDVGLVRSARGDRGAVRCDRCQLRRAVRGLSDAHNHWTTLLCRVCVDASGDSVRSRALPLHARCAKCTRSAIFARPRLPATVSPVPSPQGPYAAPGNRSLSLPRPLARHCGVHREEGEVGVKHRPPPYNPVTASPATANHARERHTAKNTPHTRRLMSSTVAAKAPQALPQA